MSQARFEPLRSADDPRVSEWLDGRLPEAEAVEIARLVAASAELTRLVDDLRRQKAALAALPASSPPRGFVQDVLAALDAAGDTAGDDAEVEEEWRRIERERLEEEIAEARADAAAPVDEPMRHRWPWLALAGALAAGVLATLVINRPGGQGDREVALVEGRRVEGRSQEPMQGGPADGPAESARQEEVADARLVKADARDKQRQAGSPPGEPPTPGAAGPAAAVVTPAEARGLAEPGAALGAEVRTVTYRVRTAADRQRLENLLAASRAENQRAERPADGAVDQAPAAEQVPQAAADDRVAAGGDAVRSRRNLGRAKAGDQAGERIVISGPPGMIANLVAALEAGPEAESGAERKPAASGPGDLLPADQAADTAVAVVLVIEIVDESAAVPAEAQP